MQKNIDLSIVIIASKIDYLDTCLRTCEWALDNLDYEIILVDNASKDNIGGLVKNKFKRLTVLRREVNGGFGENNNMGMKIARGRYVLLLNDDTKIINKQIFSEMVEWMDNHPKVGVSSCALVNPDEKTYQGSGGYFPTLTKVFLWMSFLDDIPGLDNLIKPYHPHDKYYEVIHKQDWLTGAYFLMRKSAMDMAGLFDEDFFLYVEEVELSYRFWLRGWESWYLPKWKTVHFGMSTNGSEKATIMEMQNLKLFYKKHYSQWKLPILTFLLKMGALIRIPIFGNVYAKAFKSI